MSTKTITITDPKDFKEGDLFTGVAVSEPTPGVRVRVEVTAQPLKSGTAHNGHLFVATYMRSPYVDRTEPSRDPYSNSYWESGYVTREVEEPELPSKRGIWLYYSYGLDEDGDLSHFPNLILHLSNDRNYDWYSVGNSSAQSTPLTTEEVRRAMERMVPLTLKEEEEK